MFSQDWASRLSSVSIESMARQLLANNHVQAARKLVDRVSSDHGTGSLRRLRVVLAEPVVRRRLPATAQHSGDIDWLRRNAYSYSGKWVALGDGKLLAANESLPALRRHLREICPEDQAVPASPVATTDDRCCATVTDPNYYGYVIVSRCRSRPALRDLKGFTSRSSSTE